MNRTRYLLFQVALCNQTTIDFAPLKAILTFKPYCTPLWTISFSTVTYIELWWSVIHLQKNALKIYGTHSTVDILTSDKNSVFSSNFIFPALIDDPKNIKINALIRLVVTRMFLLPKSVSLMNLVSFPGNHLYSEHLSKMDTF